MSIATFSFPSTCLTIVVQQVINCRSKVFFSKHCQAMHSLPHQAGYSAADQAAAEPQRATPPPHRSTRLALRGKWPPSGRSPPPRRRSG